MFKFGLKKLFILLLAVLFTVGCQPLGKESEGEGAISDGVIQSMILLTGSPSSSPYPSIQVTGDFLIGQTLNMYRDSACSKLTGSATITNNSTAVVSSSGLTVDATYQLYIQIEGSNNSKTSCSSNYITYVLNTGQSVLSMTHNETTTTNLQPVLEVSGIRSGWDLAIYNDSQCTSLLAEGSSISSGSLSFTVPALTEDGEYLWFAKQTDPTGEFSSNCTSILQSYVLDTKPTALSVVGTNPGQDLTPTIQVDGLIAGATVELFYDDPTCSVAANSEGSFPTVGTSLNIATTTQVNVIDPVTLTATYYAKQTFSGYESPCSAASILYVLAAAPTTFAITLPANIPDGQSETPTIEMSGLVSGSTIELFSDSTCTTSMGTDTADGSGNASVTIPGGTLIADGTYKFYAEQTYSGYTSPCSTDFAEYEFDTVPDSLTVVGDSTQNDLTPTITVNGVTPGATVHVYFGDSTCTVSDGNAVVAGGSNTVNITKAANLTAEGTFQVYTQQVLPTAYTSPCSFLSSVSTPYTLDAKPSNLASITPSPSNDDTPIIAASNIGGAGASVTLYSDSTCTTAASAATVSAGDSITVTLNSGVFSSDGTKVFYAQQTYGGLTSACSTDFVTYTLDSAPTGLVSLNGSTDTDTTPTIQVTGVLPGADVKLYTNNSCTVLVGSATAVTSAVNIDVDPSSALTSDGTYTFYATQTNGSFTSACSTASTNYTLDTEVGSLSLNNPISSPNTVISPTVTVANVEAGATVRLFLDSSCTVFTGSAVALSNIVNITSNPLPADGTHTYYSDQQIGAYTSPCSTSSLSYTLDSKVTGISMVTASPGTDLTPQLQVTGTFAGTGTLDIYTNSTCSGAVFESFALGGSGTENITLTNELASGDGTYTFYALQTYSGHPSPSCSTVSASYVLDSKPTTFTVTTGNPGTDLTPTIQINGLQSVIGDVVRLYDDSLCTNEIDNATLVANNTVDITLSTALNGDGTYSFYAKQEYGTGSHISDCSTVSIDYVLDSKPTAITINDLAGGEVNSGLELTPDITVTGIEVGGTVNIYSDSSCTTLVESFGPVATDPETFTFTTPLAADATYNYYATQTYSTHTSDCSTVSAAYTLDSTPDAITITETNPGPALNITMTVTGLSVDNTATQDVLRVYDDSACTNQVATVDLDGTGTATGLNLTTPLTGLADGARTYYATQTYNTGAYTSPCSALLLTYTFQSKPSSLSIATNPGTSLTPTVDVSVTEDTGAATVTLYSDASCTTDISGGGVASSLTGTTSVPVTTAFTAEGATNIYAQQAYGGHTSPCSDAYSYTIDRTPNTLTISAGNGTTTPTINALNTVPGTNIDLYSDSSCTTRVTNAGSTAVIATNTDIAITSADELSKTIQNYTFYAMHDGGVSSCSTDSVAFTVDIAPTNVALLTTSPGGNANPKVRVEGLLVGSQVNIFTDSSCTTAAGSSIATATEMDLIFAPGIATDSTVNIYANQVRDGGTGTTSSCSTVFATYEYASARDSWTMNEKIVDTSPVASDNLGNSVSIDGSYAVVGKPGDNANTGAILIYYFNGFYWTLDSSFTGTTAGDLFGSSVHIDGDYIITGAPGESTNAGNAYVYQRVAGVWTLVTGISGGAHTPAGGDLFGTSVAIETTQIVVGAPGDNAGDGAAFHITGATYNTLAQTFAGNGGGAGALGTSVAVEGDNIILGEPAIAAGGEVEHYIISGPYTQNTLQAPTPAAADTFGTSVALDGTELAVGSPGADAAYVLNGTNFGTTITLDPTPLVITPGDGFGNSIDINNNQVIVGAPATSTNDGAAYVFNGTSYADSRIMTAYDGSGNADSFATSVAISLTQMLIGSPNEDDGVTADTGAVYFFDQD